MTTMTRKLNLTRLEREILNHRLDVPECIVEVLVEDRGWNEEDIEAIAAHLRGGDIDAAFDINDVIAAEVLADAVEGSTYLGTVLGNGEVAKERAVYRAGCRLAEKVGALIGRTVEYPTC